ncbi:BsuPI-related putative proteinase inhibitor [Halobaculum roseum]|uniref:Intracellular proteinase inhibitor BsuPI domain-containing protein n=1 Tax=Halobaculum roseum TaxID=2175149 RepID=A0ABD5MJA2_9EURY|nr:BsuPI-related putative proteinase inhibitor [Halobaculum roseum]QZY03548.1 hypothetical protein K6T36_05115 [Halobaculum roseum]
MSEPLDPTLTVAPTDGGLTLTLTVENGGPDAVEFSFSDGQRAEFVARDAEGDEVWRWSDGRAFAMALGSETVEPGATVEYEGEWTSPEPGEYEVVGSLAATDAEAAASMTVVVPGEK